MENTELEKRLIQKGMLLHINQYPHYKYFELTSGGFAEKYITTWKLFDDLDELENYLNKLTDYCYKLMLKHRFSTIVTSTNTVKAIADLLVPKLKEKLRGNEGLLGQEIILKHFGDYPSLDMSFIQKVEFENEKVLILADVIATGTLVKKMCSLISNMNGQVVAIKALFVTGKELINKKCIIVGKDDDSSSNVEIRIDWLNKYQIEYIKKDESKKGNKYSILKIDPVTILPKEELKYPKFNAPIFSLKETFEHFSEENAMLFGFFKFGEKRFTTAFDFQKLLFGSDHNVGNLIWRKINSSRVWEKDFNNNKKINKISDFDAIVTTTSREDIDFAKFIYKMLGVKKNNPMLVTMKKEAKDTPYFYFTLSSKKNYIEGGNVLLLFSTISTTEELRVITSLLIDLGVSSVRVLCLVSRMGSYSTSFIHGINQFVYKKSSKIFFDMRSVYNYLDFNMGDLEKMSNIIISEINRYVRKTKVPNFKRLSTYYRDYLLPRSEYDYKQSEKIDRTGLEKSIEVNLGKNFKSGQKNKYEIVDENILMCWLNQYISTTKDYKQLITHISTVKNLHSLFHIIGISILDIDLLRFSDQLKEINQTIIDEIQQIRKDKIAIANELSEKKINVDATNREILSKHENEVNLMVAYSIFSLFQEPSKLDEDFINEFIYYNYSINDWYSNPLVAKLYFEDERIPFCLSLLLYSNNRNFQKESQEESIKNGIIKKINEYKQGVDKLEDLSKKYISNFERQGKKNGFHFIDISASKRILDLILMELGHFDLKRPHQVIRYLQSKILKGIGKEHHNELYHPMKIFVETLSKELKKNKNLPVMITPNLKKEFKDALAVTSELQIFSEITKYFFEFTIGSYEKQKKYLFDKHLPGFANDIFTLEKKILTLSEHKISYDIIFYKEIFGLYRKIFDDEIIKPTSVLRQSLKSWVVDVFYILNQVVSDVGRDYNKGQDEILIAVPHNNKIKFNLLVLADAKHLRETLRNVVWNILKTNNRLPEPINIRFETEKMKIIDTNEETEHIIIHIVAKTIKDFKPEILDDTNTTVGNQNARLKLLGGCITYSHSKEGRFVMQHFRIQLISRSEFKNI